MYKLFLRFLGVGFSLTKIHQMKVRFLCVGALNTVIGLAAYPILYTLMASLNIHYLFILVLCQLFCVPFSFLTNKIIVFQTSGNYIKEFRKFLTLHLSYFFMNVVALPALVEIGDMNPVWAQTFFALLVVFISYFWYSRVTFKPPIFPGQ